MRKVADFFDLNKLSPEQMQQLIVDKVHDSKFDPKQLEQLVPYMDKDCLHDFVLRWDCPPDVLRKAAADTWAILRLRVAENPYTPDDVLQQLSNDAHPRVKEIAQRSLADSQFRWHLVQGKDIQPNLPL